MARHAQLITDLAVDPAGRYPRGSDVYYECLRCRCLLPSNPADNGGCVCGNVFMDVDAFRLAVDDHRRMRVVRISEVTQT